MEKAKKIILALGGLAVVTYEVYKGFSDRVHDLKVADYCDRSYCLDNGKIVLQ